MPQNKHPLTIAAAALDQTHRPAVIAPDGRAACAAVASLEMDKNETHTELWLFPTDGGSRTAADRRRQGQRSGLVADGKWIAFCAKRKDDDEAQIYLIAPDGGEARRVTSLSTGASALRWFPDSRRIAFVSRVWPDLKSDKAQAQAPQGTQGRQGQGRTSPSVRNIGSGTTG